MGSASARVSLGPPSTPRPTRCTSRALAIRVLDLRRSTAPLPLPWRPRAPRARRHAVATAAALPWRSGSHSAPCPRSPARPHGGLPKATLLAASFSRTDPGASPDPNPNPRLPSPQAGPPRHGRTPLARPHSPPHTAPRSAAEAATTAAARAGPRRRRPLWDPDGGAGPDAANGAPGRRDGGPRGPPPPSGSAASTSAPPEAFRSTDADSPHRPQRAATAGAGAGAAAPGGGLGGARRSPSSPSSSSSSAAPWRSSTQADHGRHSSASGPRRSHSRSQGEGEGAPSAGLRGASAATGGGSSSSNSDSSRSSIRGVNTSGSASSCGSGGSGNSTSSSGSVPQDKGPSPSPSFRGLNSIDGLSYSQRVARLRKPALTAPDKLGLEPEERARIFRELRTPRRRRLATTSAGGPGGPAAARAGSLPLPLRVFCYGIDDVRLYRALEGGDAVGLVVVVSEVAAADAVWATRTKRTGKALTLGEIYNAARNAGKPFLELPTLSPVRVMEALERLTGWPVPEHLRYRPPPSVAFLPPLERDPAGSAGALALLTGGRPLPDYLISRSGPDLPPPLLRELDCTDLYDSREALRPANPQEREAARQPALFRPYMAGSRMARKELVRRQLRRRAEAEDAVPW